MSRLVTQLAFVLFVAGATFLGQVTASPNPGPRPQITVSPEPVPIPSPNFPSPTIVVPSPTVTFTSPVIPIPVPTFTGTTTIGAPVPTVLVLPGFANVTRSSAFSTSTSSTGGDSSTITSSDELTVTITVPNTVTSATETVTLPPLNPSPGITLKRRQIDASTTIRTTAQPSPTGDSAFVHGQAFAFTPPTIDQGLRNPYAGPFAVFRQANLTPEQELRLANRSYYFKGQPFSGKAQVQLSSNWTDPMSEFMSPLPTVPDVPFPVPTKPQLAWGSPDSPPVSRQALNISQSNGIVLINQVWTGLPPGFVPTSPIQGNNGAVLMPYQVAPITSSPGNQQPPPLSARPQGAATSYVVLQPQGLQSISAVSPQQSSPSPSVQITEQFAVISDIDDVLKLTNVSSPLRGLLNTFVEPYQPILGMPNVFQSAISQAYANKSAAVTFHYISGTPMPLAPGLLQFLGAYYPFGSLTLRPTTSFDPKTFTNLLTDAIDNGFRLQAHRDILDTFSSAQAVIFGDTAQRTFSTYLNVVQQYPSRVQCIYLRNLTVAEGTSNPSYRLTKDDALNQLRQRLPADQQRRAEQVLVTFTNPSELLGMNWTQVPPRCV